MVEESVAWGRSLFQRDLGRRQWLVAVCKSDSPTIVVIDPRDLVPIRSEAGKVDLQSLFCLARRTITTSEVDSADDDLRLRMRCVGGCTS